MKKDFINRTGLSRTKEYRIWDGMIKRCYDSSYKEFYLYGGRGISVCDRWRNSLFNFISDMGLCPFGKSLDRFPNNDGNYELSNCRWATPLEQSNNRRSNIRIEINSITKNFKEWCGIYGIDYKVAHSRVRKCKWDYIKALTTPIIDSKYKKKIL